METPMKDYTPISVKAETPKSLNPDARNMNLNTLLAGCISSATLNRKKAARPP